MEREEEKVGVAVKDQPVVTTYTIFMPSMYDDIKIEARCWEPQHGPERKITAWAVAMGGFVWTKKGKWEVEPMPSSRTPAFLKRARFETLEKATLAAQLAKTTIGTRQMVSHMPKVSK